MGLMDLMEKKILALLQQGLPLSSKPYEEIAQKLSLSEGEVLRAIQKWKDRGLLRRFGVVLHHDRLGYRSNAMVVFEVEEERVSELGRRLGTYPFVTLCYRRLSRKPWWPYNLYCMIHGKERLVVEGQIERLLDENGLRDLPHAILFTKQKLKQHGPRYFYREVSEETLS